MPYEGSPYGGKQAATGRRKGTVMRILLNVTSHQQDQGQWLEHSSDNVFFALEGRPLGIQVDPDRPMQPQLQTQWRTVLDAIDEAYAAGECVNGLMLAGYAPMVLGVAKMARDFRLPCFVSVMAPVPAPEGQKRQFAPSGVRWTRPAPFAKVAGKRPPTKANGPSDLVHLSPRDLTSERRALIEDLGASISKAAKIFPPKRNGEAQGEIESIEAAVAEALKDAKGILLDGPPIEVALVAWNFARDNGLPVYYLKTIPAPPPLFAQPVKVAMLPY